MSTHQSRIADVRIARKAGLVLAAAGSLLLGACANQKQDELARLTAEREQLREDTNRARQRQQTLREALAQPASEPNRYDNRTYDNTSDTGTDDRFGAGTTVSRRSGDLVVEVAGDVLFDPGSVKLKPTSKKTLDR